MDIEQLRFFIKNVFILAYDNNNEVCHYNLSAIFPNRQKLKPGFLDNTV